MPKIVIACGGTGGHIYPALAIAEHLPKDELIFIGTKDRLEAELIPREGYTFQTIVSSRSNPFTIFKGVLQSAKLLTKLNPEIIISTGGYVTIPVIIAGFILGVPVYLQEQNLLPGKVNRFLGHFAKKIFYSFPETKQYFKKKGLLIGTPVRRKILKTQDHVKDFSKQPNKILILGGSQGAKAIDEVIPKVDFSAVNSELMHLNQQNYEHDIHNLLSEAHLVVCRAGASTLAELAISGLPAILIPYPYAAGNHQYYNAKAFADAEAAIILEQSRLSPQVLISIIKSLLESPGRLQKMSVAMKKMARPQAASEIAKIVKEKIGYAERSN
ncbi:undecaprenyldiphospho-muramoylpentapeptide beta-N-acetylglucosaminyltransferase [Candidatus Margulisiibacteriota bacterium]